MAGWTVATLLPPLVIAGTAYWAAPTTGSGLLWGLLEGVAGSAVMLGRSSRLGWHCHTARPAQATSHGPAGRLYGSPSFSPP